jgi:hypothetical protein
MKLSIFFLLISLCCLIDTVPAQILNVEKQRLSGDSVNYFLGNITAAFSANNLSINDEGETVSFVGLNANSDFGYISEHHSFMLLSDFNYAATSDDPINSTGYGHFRINFLRDRDLSYEAFTQLQYDQGRGMEVRWLAGGGIRLHLLKKKDVGIYAGIGAMYENEVWETPGAEERTVTLRLWKSSNYLSSRIRFNEHVNLNLIAYYQTGYDFDREFFRHRVSSDLNLLVGITEVLSLTTSVFAGYENRPVVPITKFIYSVSNGIQLSF